MGPPLLVHLVFHPKAAPARALAHLLHRALNDDTSLPGLAIPTRIVSEDGSEWPPTDYRLDEAEHSVVVLLADDKMAIDEQAPAGHIAWAEFAARLNAACKGERHRFIPLQLSESAWPLHDELRSTNFIRAHLVKEGDERARYAERSIVIELCRFLLGTERGSEVPVKVFLSHAKQDVQKEPRLLEALESHLTATKPVSGWIDSGQIVPGRDFGAAIESGIRDTAVLALVTENYSSRAWCRREVLLAKRLGRPLVIVDGLGGIDVRAFPYLGNAPMMAWSSGGAQRAIDLVLKEELRQLHTRQLLQRSTVKGDVVLTVPPELSTIASLPQHSTVLYPDPPLGDEETEVLNALSSTLETPLQRVARDRALSDRKIALSISESDCPERGGMFQEHLNAALLEISRHLLAKGATLTYGGHLGSSGYTLKLFDLVLAYRSLSGLPPAERIVNYVGWPLPLTDEARATYRWQASLLRTDIPPEVPALDPGTFVAKPTTYLPPDTPVRRYAWARGMSLMREKQTVEMNARVALGGKVGPTRSVQPDGSIRESWYSGRIPGVLEEIVLALRSGKPLYLCGAFGGATAAAIELLEGRTPQELTWEFQRQAPYSEELRGLYSQHGIPWEDYPELAKFCAHVGLSGLSRANHLTPEQNREFFGCRDVRRIIELLLTGLTFA